MSGSGQSLMKDLKAIPSKGSQRIHKTASIPLNVQQNERMGGCKTWILRSTTLCVYPMSTCDKLSRAFSPPCLDTANIGWRWWRPRNEVICMCNLDCKSSDSGRVWSGSFLHPKSISLTQLKFGMLLCDQIYNTQHCQVWVVCYTCYVCIFTTSRSQTLLLRHKLTALSMGVWAMHFSEIAIQS